MELPKLRKIDPNKPKKKKILLLADDFRLPSGIGTISREIIFNTVHHYDWVQLGAALKHPEAGQAFDLSVQVAQETGVPDASVKIIPWNGYGDRNVLFAILNQERPDAIFHFTDPRYWTWLYAIEHEIKTTFKLPIIYYSIWDDLPYPMWNAPFYASCDLIMGISKQSDNIHREVLTQNGFDIVDYDADVCTADVKWNQIITGFVPHGLNHNTFKPLSQDDVVYKQMHERIKIKNGVDFVVFWNNRNIRRKQPGDVILAFKTFVDALPKEKQNQVALLMHTQIVDENGTDLNAIHKTLAPECKIIFSEQKMMPNELNAMYNVADVVVNIGSNEGWGLSSTEAMLSGTPIINNVTGGLQDQCGFVDENDEWIRFNSDLSTNHTGKYKNHGIWVKPVFPSNRSLQGSPQTPYIFDDRARFEDVADAIRYWYDTPEMLRESMGQSGREWCLKNGLTAQQMGQKMIKMIDYLFQSKPQMRKNYTIHKVTTKKYEKTGIVCEQ
ncbi:MAG: glycosyltransferase family 1 protein [Microbacteriaceae bacterium]|nr:glycosyltransferase family 1 protein [Microbacteriaceae bacterium]NBS61503.1 glycosyltransferase family 1 protein [Microbacteriaceae bacterium]